MQQPSWGGEQGRARFHSRVRPHRTARVALDSVETLLAFAREEQSPRARSSMLTDLEADKPLEVEFLSGAVARHGKAAGVPTPVHDVVSAVLAPHAGKV